MLKPFSFHQSSLAALFGILICAPVASQAQTAQNPETKQAVVGVSFPQSEKVDTGNLLVPESREVTYDVQSALASSKHQEGFVGEWQYLLYPDGTARVRRKSDKRGAGILVTCELGVSCKIDSGQPDQITVEATGAPAPALPQEVDGLTLAHYVAKSVLAGTGAVEPETVAAETEALIEPAPQSEPETPAKDRDLAQQPSETELAEAEVTPSKPLPKAEPAKAEPPAVKPVTVVQKTVKAAAPKTRAKQIVPRPKRPDCSSSGTCRKASAVSKGVSRTVNVQPEPLVQAPKPRLTWPERYKLSCSARTTIGLRYVDHNDNQVKTGKPRVSVGCSAQITDRFSARVSLVHYLVRNQQAPSDPDFTYALNYKLTKKINLSYSNYSARFQGGGTNFSDSLKSGSLRASYKWPTIKLPNDKKANCSTSVGLPNPRDSSLRVSCGIAITKKLFVGATVHGYFPGVQDSFDPDFSYTATYKIADDWRVTYSNYGNNRFPWNKSSNPGQGLFGGSFTVSYQFKF